MNSATPSTSQQNSAGTVPAMHGTDYQIGLLMLLFERGFTRNLKDFELESEVNDAIKFDDVVFNEGNHNYRLIQLKYKSSKKSEKITVDVLFGDDFNNNFNLLKYVLSYVGAKNRTKFQNVKIKDAIVFTNSTLDVNKNNEMSTGQRSNYFCQQKTIKVSEIQLDPIDLLNVTDKHKIAKCYKFNASSLMIDALLAYADHVKSKPKNANIQQRLNILNPTNIEEALEKIIFCVGQSSDDELFQIVQKEIEEHFKLNSSEETSRKLRVNLGDWIKTKTGPFPEIIKFDDAKTFFDANVMQDVLFDVIPPTSEFVGRELELESISKKLKDKGACVISPQVSICGLGGIGKTQLARKFIAKYKQDFYNRVIWINAEKNDTTADSFKRLIGEQKIKIDSNLIVNETEKIKSYINLVVQHFRNVSVLFVLDNAVQPNDEEFSFISHFRKSLSSFENKIYILITSRDKDFGGKVENLDLSLLTINEASKMLTNQLENVSIEDANYLVQELQQLPLALQQAISYIKETNEALKVCGKSFTVSEYIERLKSKNDEIELLEHNFNDDFGDKHLSTTFKTWDITFEHIKTVKFGAQANKIINYIAFLEPDNIDPSLVLKFFQNQNAEEIIGKAFKLLKKYSILNSNETILNSMYIDWCRK
jgi:hypothetical protein